MRFIGMDVHRDFCEVAIAEGGEVRRARAVPSNPAALELFARSLAGDDQVVMEASFGAARIAEIVRPHVGRVVVCDPRRLAKADARKTDRRDARRLAELLAQGFLDEVWSPDPRTGELRRLISRRAALVRARTRAKNELQAVLARELCPRPPADPFGKRGRAWLRSLALPAAERVTLEGALRQVDFLGAELAELDGLLAAEALGSAEARRLMGVPGVGAVTALGFLASVGDIGRFGSPRKLVAYLGLDPRVRQSGQGPARHGGISKAGRASARHLLVEAAWVAARSPGPHRAFFERVRARRGAQVAAVALARKLAVLFWHLLSKGEDYAHERPSTSARKLRRLELAAGAERRQGTALGERPLSDPAAIAAERKAAERVEADYRRLTEGWRARKPKRAPARQGGAHL